MGETTEARADDRRHWDRPAIQTPCGRQQAQRVQRFMVVSLPFDACVLSGDLSISGNNGQYLS